MRLDRITGPCYLLRSLSPGPELTRPGAANRRNDPPGDAPAAGERDEDGQPRRLQALRRQLPHVRSLPPLLCE
jgi:hypothetical protein